MGRRALEKNGLIGQRRVWAFLGRAVRSAQSRGEACHPVLLLGPHGSGRATLARAWAAECGTQLHRFGPGRHAEADACELLAGVRHGDFVFLAAADRLTLDAQAVLAHALDQSKTYQTTRTAAGVLRLDRSSLVSVAEFTLVAAAPAPGAFLPELEERLLPLRLDDYTEDELRAIAARQCAAAGRRVTPQACGLLARAAQGSPGRLGQHLRGLAQFRPELAEITAPNVAAYLAALGQDADGRTWYQRRYLAALRAAGERGCARAVLASRLGVRAGYLDGVEQRLLARGWIDFTAAGRRVLTPAGREAAADADGVAEELAHDDE